MVPRLWGSDIRAFKLVRDRRCLPTSALKTHVQRESSKQRDDLWVQRCEEPMMTQRFIQHNIPWKTADVCALWNGWCFHYSGSMRAAPLGAGPGEGAWL